MLVVEVLPTGVALFVESLEASRCLVRGTAHRERCRQRDLTPVTPPVGIPGVPYRFQSLGQQRYRGVESTGTKRRPADRKSADLEELKCAEFDLALSYG